jgi:apolipoprotein D and lipocalin family protein
MKYFLLFFSLFLASCTGVPKNVEPVQGFQLEKYLGAWYEIARLDHSFERGLSHVTANYSVNEDGSVKVINKGYSKAKGEWKSVEGKARLVKTPEVGHLKVSFFGPFYSSYVIFELEKNYQYALVSGKDKNNLWILARQPQISPDLLDQLLKKAQSLGFATEQLILVEQ